MTLIKPDNNVIIIPLYIYLPDNIKVINIPARSQMIQAINIKVDEDSVVLNKELIDGVFVSNTIIPKNGIVHVKLLNTNECDVSLKNLQLDIKPLRNYHVVQSIKKETREARAKKLLDEIKTAIEGLDEFHKNIIQNICEQYSDIFYLEGDMLTVNNFYKQTINLADKNPVYIKNYRQPHNHIVPIRKEIEKLIKNDVIEPSISSYNSPIILVPKKSESDEKKFRLVIDYRQLNKKIENDKFPITRLEDALDQMGRAKYFSTLDLTSSFHQIGLEKDSKKCTAFSTQDGHYQFKRLPFGLKISSNSFQRMITIALAGLESDAFLYVDDVIVFGCSLEHHNKNLIKVFNRFRKYNLKLNPQKCNFLRSEVTFLGHLITDNGVKPDPKKFAVVKNYPVPQDANEAHRFVAFCNYYRRFIENFANIAKPLYSLLKKDAKFIWSEDCNNSFNTLKEKLINPPILQYPDFTKPFIVTTDASNFALGAILSQGKYKEDLPIAYASKMLNTCDQKKGIMMKELLAIHFAINHFKPYLIGKKFFVVTDHKPLVSLFSHKKPSMKLERIRLDLMEYDFEIIYRPGKLNVCSDSLSRIKIDTNLLKMMIPNDSNNKNDDEKIDREIKVMTRNQRKLANDVNNTNNNKTNDDGYVFDEPDQFIKAYDAISLSCVRSARIVEFIPVQDTKTKNITFERNKIKVEIVGNKLKSCKNLKNLLYQLCSNLINENINKICIKNNDLIFNFIKINEFKESIKNINDRFGNLKKYLNIIIYTPPTILTDKEEIIKVVEEYHCSLHGGHAGIRRTILKIKQKYIFKNLTNIVKNFVNNCLICAKTKVVKPTKEQLALTETPNRSLENISIDLVGPLKPYKNFRYILTIQCDLSKYIQLIPIETKEAVVVAKALVTEFFLRFGFVKQIKTDLGTEFVNEIFKEMCKLCKIDHRTSTAYRHQTLGQIEKNHRHLREFILAFSNEGDYDWYNLIPYFCFAYNTTPFTDFNYTPYELVFGKLCKLPTDITNTNDMTGIYNLENYSNELKFRLRQAHLMAKDLLNAAKSVRQEKSKKYTNPIAINVGDEVLIEEGTTSKYKRPYNGPYRVIEVDDLNAKVEINENIIKVHKNRLKKVKQNSI